MFGYMTHTHTNTHEHTAAHTNEGRINWNGGKANPL